MELVTNKPRQITWQEKCQHEAIRMADQIIKSFNQKMTIGERLLPDIKDVNQRAEELNIFMDALIGSVVVLATTYGNCFQQQEECVVNAIRAHFRGMRGTQLGMEGEDVRVPLRPEDKN